MSFSTATVDPKTNLITWTTVTAYYGFNKDGQIVALYPARSDANRALDEGMIARWESREILPEEYNLLFG